MSRARVLIADDHQILAEGLRSLLEPEFEVVAVVADGRQLVAVTVDPGVSITTSSPLSDGTVGDYYFQEISATGADAYSFGISSGNLPPGLDLDPVYGYINGTPTSVGVYHFSVTATGTMGAGNSDTVNYTVTIGTT